MSKKKQKDINYLDFIPVRKEEFRWDQDDAGAVTIYVENKGPFNRLAQKILHKPKTSQIHLEETGSFIWPLIDGKRSVYDIGLLVKEEFGDAAEPLYPRLSKYMQMLINCGFIEMLPQ